MESIVMKDEKRRLLILMLVTFISFLGSSIAYPILPPLFLDTNHHTLITSDWAVSTRRFFLGVTLAVFSLGQFIGSPILGKYADVRGRKKTLIASLFFSGIGYLFTAIALEVNSFSLLLLSRFWTGLMEGSFGIVRSITAELTQINKFVSFGRIKTMTYVGFIAGPPLGGFFSDEKILPCFSYAMPFWVAGIASFVALFFAYRHLSSQVKAQAAPSMPILQQLNIFRQMKLLFERHPGLKSLLLISSIFTLSVDVFYQFGPVYLAGKWSMPPAKIAIYNATLSMALAAGASVIPHYLSKRMSIQMTLILASAVSSLIFYCMMLFQAQLSMLCLFAFAGLSITTVTTSMSVHISNNAHQRIQGEVFGVQASLRTLCEALTCLLGGLMIVVSFVSPIILSCLGALITAALCVYYFSQAGEIRTNPQ